MVEVKVKAYPANYSDFLDASFLEYLANLWIQFSASFDYILSSPSHINCSFIKELGIKVKLSFHR